MIKSSKTYCLFITVLITISICFSKNIFGSNNTYKVYTPKAKLPLEFIYLINSIQKYNLTKKERQLLDKTVVEIDYYLSLMNWTERYFILKTEIYKQVLKSNLNQILNLKNYKPDFLQLANDELKEKKNSYHSFAKWLILATHSDLKKILSSNDFLSFHEAIITDQSTTKYIKLKKHLTLLLPIYDKMINLSPEEFHDEIRPTMLHLFETLSKLCHLFLKQTYFNFSIPAQKEQPLKLFKVTKIALKKSNKISIDDILDPLIEPTPTIEDQIPSWIPKAEPAYKAPENLPEPVYDWFDGPSKHSDYMKPSQLPKPSSDWFDSVNPNPEYTPPANLPNPLDDWFPAEEENKLAVPKKQKTKKESKFSKEDPEDEWIIE